MWYNALRHVRLSVCSTEGKSEVDNSLKKWRKLRLIKNKAKEIVDILCLRIFCWERLKFDKAPERLSTHLPLDDGDCSERVQKQLVWAGKLSFSQLWKCSLAVAEDVEPPCPSPVGSVSVRFALSLLCLRPLCSASSNLTFQSVLSKQTGLSRSWQPAQGICFHLLLSGCGWEFSQCKTGAAQRCLQAETPQLVAYSGAPRGSCLFSPRICAVSYVYSMVYPKNWRASGGIQPPSEIRVDAKCNPWPEGTAPYSRAAASVCLLLEALGFRFCFSSVNVHIALHFFSVNIQQL